jgi:hypothetical protein
MLGPVASRHCARVGAPAAGGGRAAPPPAPAQAGPRLGRAHRPTPTRPPPRAASLSGRRGHRHQKGRARSALGRGGRRAGREARLLWRSDPARGPPSIRGPHAGAYRAHARPRRLGCAGASSARRPAQVPGPAGSGGRGRRVQLPTGVRVGALVGRGIRRGRWRRAGRMGGRVVDGLGHRCRTARVQSAARCMGSRCTASPRRRRRAASTRSSAPVDGASLGAHAGARPAGSAPALTPRHRCGELRDAAMPGRLLEGVTEPEHRRFVVWLRHELEPDWQPVVREARRYGHGGHPGLRGD